MFGWCEILERTRQRLANGGRPVRLRFLHNSIASLSIKRREKNTNCAALAVHGGPPRPRNRALGPCTRQRPPHPDPLRREREGVRQSCCEMSRTGCRWFTLSRPGEGRGEREFFWRFTESLLDSEIVRWTMNRNRATSCARFLDCASPVALCRQVLLTG